MGERDLLFSPVSGSPKPSLLKERKERESEQKHDYLVCLKKRIFAE